MTFKERLSIKIRKHIQEIATMTKRVERERERERKTEREMMKWNRKYHTCCLKFYVAFARLALSLYFLF